MPFVKSLRSRGEVTAAGGALVLLGLLLSACRQTPDGPHAGRADAVVRVDAAARVDAALSPAIPHPITIAPGSDEPPAQRLTPEQTLPFVPDYQRDRGYAPAVGSINLESLDYDAQEQLRDGPTGLGLLVCRAGTLKNVDSGKLFWDAPDLDLEIRVLGLTVRQNGPEDRGSAVFTLPLVSLLGGEVVAVHMRDRDGPRHLEEVGTVSATFVGKLPFGGMDGQNALFCGHLPQTKVEESLKETLQSTDKALSALADDLKVRPVGDDLGLAYIMNGCRRYVSDLAALVGWGDPRVQRRSEWCQRMERKLSRETLAHARAAEARAATVTALRLQTSKTTLEVSRPRRDCQAGVMNRAFKRFDLSTFADARRYACLLRVPVRNVGQELFLYSSVAADVDPTILLTVISSLARTEKTGLIGMDGGVFTPNIKGLAPEGTGVLLFPVSEKSGRLMQLSTSSAEPHENDYMLIDD